MTDCGYGTLEFSSSLLKLDEGFKWARQQALSYVHNGEDAVGLWYEAALPARNAFCMRDTVCHARRITSVTVISGIISPAVLK